MTVLTVIKYPRPVLRQRCAPVADVDDTVRRLADDMRETMLAAKGIGLAAPQIGETIRLLVTDTSEKRDEPLALANPNIIAREGDITLEEGCLSAPGVTAPVARSRYVEVCGLNMAGEEITVCAEELLAVCLQHEIDHLDGVMFFDHLSALRRWRLLEKYNKQQR